MTSDNKRSCKGAQKAVRRLSHEACSLREGSAPEVTNTMGISCTADPFSISGQLSRVLYFPPIRRWRTLSCWGMTAENQGHSNLKGILKKWNFFLLKSPGNRINLISSELKLTKIVASNKVSSRVEGGGFQTKWNSVIKAALIQVKKRLVSLLTALTHVAPAGQLLVQLLFPDFHSYCKKP